MYQLFIFNDSHNLKTKINREKNEQAISWDLDMLSAWNFPNLIDYFNFTPGVTFNFILCVEGKIRDCMCASFLQSRSSSRYTNCLQNIRWATCEHFNTMSLSECDKTNQSIQSCYVFFFFSCFLFYFLPLFFSQEKYFFTLNEKWKFDLVQIILKIKTISPLDTITSARGKQYLLRGD